ncbi:MAG: DUF1289 domain-containing protein [Pseudomonadales bacterium]|uniref:DUF1289 domain-containing protein n=1 Tax=unclassified Ketobacter TaxID=2639109 RepID=UPI000C46E7D7|nr:MULTISPECIES: DUF1289 domain-containing protein [unclassified Ketobacter]MAA60361.1 DUF1289 domain-containing protein [Pseudomonadales bacterium]MEC8809742.1 DUF1289 domain-containing protein [Pseudomonadota bacterium]TNC90637.1 MAG: DUF1289 domain-containing protein [Alcanivorax sp.]HAG96124.1 DUF1289 domain-containing protein [Gammaproteobacteria bacterium]MAQ25629.1 DUF1289 domain-containing protein [Pseudomonadales bacterium]
MPGSCKDRPTQEAIPSPCVRNCCLNDDDVCLGCGRTLDDIRNWTRFSPQERDQALVRARERTSQFTLWKF